MKLNKDIIFNSKDLIGNKNIKISYFGKLAEKSEKVFAHFGYNNNWENISDQEMKKTDFGFETNLKIKNEYEFFNIVFHDGKGNWDNNYNENYVFEITRDLKEGIIIFNPNSLSYKINRFNYFFNKKIKLFLSKIRVFLFGNSNYEKKLKKL